MKILEAPEASKLGGSIGYYGLQQWWLTVFDDNQRAYIKTRFQPLGLSADSLTCGEISYSSQSVVGFLSALAGWFQKAQDRPLGYKMLDKAFAVSGGANVLDMHFLYNQAIMSYYKDRALPEFMHKALDACRKQIALATAAAEAFQAKYPSSSLPSHRGYEQLVIVLEKRGQYNEAIALCCQAMSQGWCGDWNHRVERCEKKVAKV